MLVSRSVVTTALRDQRPIGAAHHARTTTSTSVRAWPASVFRSTSPTCRVAQMGDDDPDLLHVRHYRGDDRRRRRDGLRLDEVVHHDDNDALRQELASSA